MTGRLVRLLVCAGVGAGVMTGAPAHAQSAAVSPPPQPQAAQVQQLRDDLDRLRKEFEALRQTYDQRITTLEQRIGDLSGPNTGRPEQQVQPPVPTQPPVPPASPTQVPLGSSKVFNPDTSVIGNFIGVGGKNALNDQPSMQMSEVEAAFQAFVDPYARADFFLSAGPEGLEVEEGFITFNTLPGGLLLKVGKMRAQFGKVNTMHSHILPWADRPLVTQNLVGGEEGISDSGLSLSKLIPNSLVYLEATGEVFAGRSEVFHSDERSKLNYLGRLRAYRDLTEGTNLDVGTSFAYGPANLGDFSELLPRPGFGPLNRRLIGIDATYRFRPLRRAIYTQFKARTELVWSRQDTTQNAFGMYISGDYQFARRWFIGGRFDQSERAFAASLRDRGGSVLVTFWPSEFSQVRGQYRRTNYAEGVSANEFLFQFNFTIGAHGAHVF